MKHIVDHMNPSGAKARVTNFRFALVIEQADSLRISVVELLRKQGWLVHGITRAEQAFNILAHIPYGLIVVDSELPGISGIEFVRILHNSKEDWRKIQVVVLTNSQSAELPIPVAERGAFVARKSKWEDDLFRFLRALYAFKEKKYEHTLKVEGKEAAWPIRAQCF